MAHPANNAATMAHPGIETFVVFAFFKGDGGEKGDRGADGPKVTSQNKDFNLQPSMTNMLGGLSFLGVSTLTPGTSFYSNYVIA